MGRSAVKRLATWVGQQSNNWPHRPVSSQTTIANAIVGTQELLPF